jgi:hypothetical protein
MRTGNPWKCIGSCTLILMVLALTTACAGRGATSDAPAASSAKADAPSTDPALAKRYRVVAVDEFETAAEIAKDYPDASRECQSGAVQALKDKKLWASVDSGKTALARRDGTLWVKAKVIDMRIVSGAARIWGGAFAGSSHMEVELRLIDGATGQTVREKKLSSANNPWAAAWVGGASDHSLPADVGRMIAEYVASVMPK